MRKSNFWWFLVVGSMLIPVAILFLHLAFNQKTESPGLFTFYLLSGLVSAVFGIAFLGDSLSEKGKGYPVEYLLNGKEYKKHFESRKKFHEEDEEKESAKCVRLLLSPANKKGGFESYEGYYQFTADSLLDKDGNMLKELPETFFVRIVKKEDKTFYYIYPSRTNKA